MNILLHLLGTFLMFLGFLGILAGLFLHRMKPQDLGRMYLSATMMSGGEMAEGRFLRGLTALRADDGKRRQWAVALCLSGILVALAGAAIG